MAAICHWKEHSSMFVQQPQQAIGDEQVRPQTDRFRALCAELDEYDHLPEMTPGAHHPTHLITGQSHEDTLDASILAGLTLP
jgi:hypothetical protein